MDGFPQLIRFLSRLSSSRSVGGLAPDEIQRAVDDYASLAGGDEEQRKANYDSLAERYYTLVTDFFEFGWGRSFHFAPRRRGESFRASVLRHEHFLADRLRLNEGMQVLDVGCGVGGPMANLARHTGASFVGINLNPYQIARAKQLTKDLQDQCRFIHADFMQIPEADEQFDAAYDIGSTIHAGDKVGVFREVLRVLRPGACFGGYAWCLTDRFDHQRTPNMRMRIKSGILRGNGLPDVVPATEVCSALQAAGFEVLETRDLALNSDPETPWYRALQGRDLSLSSVPRTQWDEL